MRQYLILLVLLPFCAFARGIKSDSIENQTYVELSVSAEVNKSLPHNFSIELREEIENRLYFHSDVHPNIPKGVSIVETSRSYTKPAAWTTSKTQLFVSYRPIQYLSMGVGYRLDIQGGKGWKDPSEFLRHNLLVGFTAQYKYQQWKFSFRERFDARFRTDSVNPDEKSAIEMVLRHRLTASYTMRSKPFRYILSCELFNTLNRPTAYLNQNRMYINYLDDYGNAVEAPEFGQYISTIRPTVGVEWRLNKHNSLSLSYMFKYNRYLDVNITKIPADNPQKGGNIELTRENRMSHAISIAYQFNH